MKIRLLTSRRIVIQNLHLTYSHVCICNCGEHNLENRLQLIMSQITWHSYSPASRKQRNKIRQAYFAHFMSLLFCQIFYEFRRMYLFVGCT